MHRLTRRSLLRRAAGAGVVAAGTLAGGTGMAALTTLLRPGVAGAAAAEPFTTSLPIPAVLTDGEITLTATLADVPIRPGAATRMWTFNGTFPGPTIRRPSGSTTRVTVQHRLPPEADTLTIHHHGAHTASVDDGLPEGVNPDNQVIAPGADRTYCYTHVEGGEPERAALQWYHDHSHHRTSFNTYMGLAGLFILDDEFEAALPLPRGPYEVPLVLASRFLDESDNQLDTAAFATHFSEVGGAAFLTNGAEQPYLDVEPRRYRLRVHNASGFQAYNVKLAKTGSAVAADAVAAPALAFEQIGTEAGLLPAALIAETVHLGPAERADLVVDFAGLEGQTLVLASVPRATARALAPAPAPALSVPGSDAGTDAVFLQLRVGDTVTEADPGPLPAALRPLPAWAPGAAEQPDRVWVFGQGIDSNALLDPADPAAGPQTDRVNAWTVNGRPFDHLRVDARPELGATETWLLLNATTKTHYIHLHDVDWFVLSRNGAAPDAGESGLKETFRLDPGELVLVASTFTDHLGPYMVHCHMLDHEDDGMMATFEVVPPGAGTPTTVTADEQRRLDTLLAAIARNPGAPAPLELVTSLATTVRVSDDGSPYRCTLV